MNKRTILAAAKISVVLLACFLLVFSAGCKKKTPPPAPPAPAVQPPPPPPPPAKPAITSFTAEPSTIERGQSAMLRWATTNATDISIDNGVGAVQSQGSRTVYPNQTTTYTLTANGPGGSDTRTVTVNITVPPPPPPPVATPKRGAAEILESDVQDIYFDYDKSDVRGDQQDQARKDADVLKQIFADNPNFTVVVEGHCDERGSAEYNMGLGDRRASAVRDFLVSAGVPADRLRTMSYGKEKPQCTDATEECYQKNRRAHFAPGQ